ncbi:hypothetical protein DFP72DRAFT_847281 [Ephemerocybe angulata]|uniref:Uncharacterized protein n=1 Tax=Ephemerocybe angulata TaxID=980116 RepID=A0A8H6I093_9AGAR|nr:hypothetical protein DFP72DRAFT_847281 [Tulosesus angulatus]
MRYVYWGCRFRCPKYGKYAGGLARTRQVPPRLSSPYHRHHHCSTLESSSPVQPRCAATSPPLVAELLLHISEAEWRLLACGRLKPVTEVMMVVKRIALTRFGLLGLCCSPSVLLPAQRDLTTPPLTPASPHMRAIQHRTIRDDSKSQQSPFPSVFQLTLSTLPSTFTLDLASFHAVRMSTNTPLQIKIGVKKGVSGRGKGRRMGFQECRSRRSGEGEEGTRMGFRYIPCSCVYAYGRNDNLLCINGVLLVALQMAPKMDGAMDPKWTLRQHSSWRPRVHTQWREVSNAIGRELWLEPWLPEHVRLCPPFESHSTHHFCWNPQWNPMASSSWDHTFQPNPTAVSKWIEVRYAPANEKAGSHQTQSHQVCDELTSGRGVQAKE